MRRLSLLSLALLGCEAAPDDAAPCTGLDLDADGVCDGAHVDWSEDATLPEEGHRANLYGLDPADLPEVVARGLDHTYTWPVDVSGIFLPYGPMVRFLDGRAPGDPLYTLARGAAGFGNLEEMYDWMGLSRFREGDHLPPGAEVGDAMGAGVVDTPWGQGMTFSCATCHTTSMFGRTVVGLTNHRPRANAFFEIGRELFPLIPADVFQELTDATDDEMVLFQRARERIGAIGAKEPAVLGLDTSLAQVALSLARREPDAWATFSAAFEAHPRPNGLDELVADSKPAVWWTMKYKTRWLSDGSIRSGNPVFTNFLWNELGRATDLHDLEAWMLDHQTEIDELTVAVFATEAPRYVDWFGADAIDLEAARRGQGLFDAHCAECHGTYEKGWEAADAASLPLAARLATTRVDYHPQTPVVDVGTDPQRAQGMEHFAEGLNGLAISQRMQTVVEVQAGYVPPPLEGIWARYPYLHNNSVPTLCALLSLEEDRPTEFWQGPTDDAETDFDDACVGYPVGDAIPAAWREEEGARFDTTRPGLSNRGHTAMLVGPGGEELLTEGDKRDLIAFLKTL